MSKGFYRGKGPAVHAPSGLGSVSGAAVAAAAPNPTLLMPGANEMKQFGFTGNICSSCGAAMMVRNGTCEKCTVCGTTTGCS